MDRYIGFDIGGTKIDAGLVKGNEILNRKIVPTPKNKKDFVAAVLGVIRELAGGRGKSVKGIGIAMAGAIDRKSGKIVRSPNLPRLNGLNLKKAVERKLKIPVRIDNDAKCFLRAEAKFGAARKAKNAVGLILGTGVGAGIMIGGKIYYGRDEAAGEIGHTIIKINSKFKILNSKQIMDNLFSFEDLVSKKGFAAFGIKDAKKLEDLAKKGDKKALAIHEIIGAYLGIGLANIVNVLNPEIIVLGGGLSRAGKLLTGPACRVVKKLALAPKAKKTPIVVSKLGKEAGIRGAVLLFFE